MKNFNMVWDLKMFNFLSRDKDQIGEAEPMERLTFQETQNI